MASHGIRKLGLITGLLMLAFFFIDRIGPVDLFIARVPAGTGSVLSFYIWGYTIGSIIVPFFSLTWPSILAMLVTFVPYVFSVALTIAACTPGSVASNSKRMFALASMFCFVQLSVYIFLTAFSSVSSDVLAHFGLGFYAIFLFAILDIISLAKVKMQ
jgi:hypothetical protein